jgi:hypothetical protein
LNGLNQFQTQFNPFGQANRNRFPAQQTSQFTTRPSAPGTDLRGNFQSVRFPNGQVVRQNQQFGVITSDPSQAAFNPQQGGSQQQQQQQQEFSSFAPFAPTETPNGGATVFRQTSQRFPPQQDTSSVLTGFSIQSPNGAQSSNTFSQSFGQPFIPTPSPPVFSGTPQSSGSARFAQPTIPVGQVEEDPRVRQRVRGSSGLPIEVPDSTTPTANRGSPRFRERFTSPSPTGGRSRGRLAPKTIHSDPFQTDFGVDPADRTTTPPPTLPPARLPTPPSRLSRVRGRPIVPEDFPGPTAAIRGPVKEPVESVSTRARGTTGTRAPPTGARDTTGTRGSSLTGNRSRGRPGSGVRIIPTGKRARRPIGGTGSREEQEEEVEKDLPEIPRASSNSGRPINRIPLADTDINPSGFPRRRLRPLSGSRSPIPSRRLRPLSTSTTEEVFVTTEEDITVPTVPTRGGFETTVRPTSSSKPDSFFDPNILIAQVQATKADHLDFDIPSKLDRETKPQRSGGGNSPFIENSEESNIIPFSDVASDDNVPTEQVFADQDITLINLQKDRSKQNFKGFVDTDLIDDNLRTRVAEATPAFIPTRPPSRRVTAARSTTTSTTEAVTTTTSTTQTYAPFQPTLPVTDSTSTRSSSTSTSTTTAGTTSTSTTTQQQRDVNINDKLDRLQSSLDPWAHIRNEHVQEEAPLTTTEPTTTRLSLFHIQREASSAKSTTTTFKPRSLADLFKFRAGQKLEYTDDPEQPRTEQSTTTSTTTQRTINTSSRNRGVTRSRQRLSKFRPSTTTARPTSVDPRLPRLPDKPDADLFDRQGHTPPSVLRASTTPKPSVRDIFASIPVEKTANFLPADFQARAPTTSKPHSQTPTPPSAAETTTTTPIMQEDVSAFLPPGYRVSTTSTSTESTLVADIFSSVSLEDIDDSLLPQEFKEKHGIKASGGRGRHNSFRPSKPSSGGSGGYSSGGYSSGGYRKKDNTVAKVRAKFRSVQRK